MILDVQRGVAIADEFDTGAPDEICMVGNDPPLARVEHLLHEAIHSISLRMTPSLGMVSAVGTMLDGFADRGVWEEAKVLACEALLFERVGRPLDMLDVSDTASIQQVDDETLDRALASPETSALLDRTLAWAREVGLVREV